MRATRESNQAPGGGASGLPFGQAVGRAIGRAVGGGVSHRREAREPTADCVTAWLALWRRCLWRDLMRTLAGRFAPRELRLLDAARDSFGPITDVVGECVVRPAAWAISASFSLLWGGVHAVIGLCFSSPDGVGGWGLDERAVHDKRQ